MKHPIAMNLLVFGPEMDQNVLAELAFIAETGYQGIEIPIFNTDLAHWEAWKNEADRLGLQIFACGIAGPNENLISPDAAVRKAGLEYIKATIDIAAYLGSPYISGPIHSALGVFTGKPATEQEINWAVDGVHEAANYAASKGGLTAMTKAIAQELASRNVTANCVAPGFIATAMTETLPDAQKEALNARIPMGRMGEGADIGAAVAYLASREAGYVTGQTIHVNGGMAML